MPKRAVTPHRSTTTLVTGHFRRGAGYRSWRPAGTQDWLLILTLAGHGRFGNDAILARPGDLVLIKPNTPHDYGTATGHLRWELLWAHFNPRPEWLDWMRWPELSAGMMRVQLSPPAIRRSIEARFDSVHRLATGPERHHDDLAMNALEEVILRCDAAARSGDADALDPRIRAATDWLCRSLEQRVTLDGIADAVGMSTSRLAHLFRKQVNVAPLQYLEMQRMRRAKQLLAVSGLSVKQIAAEVGFDNPFYFTLRFNRSTGMSPTAFRAQHASLNRSSSRSRS